MTVRSILAAGVLVTITSLASCDRSGASSQTLSTATPDPRPELRVFESERRARTDFTSLPPSDRSFGPDPYAIASVDDGRRFVATLRGQDAVVLLDASARELVRVATPPSPTGVAVSLDGQTVFVVGERQARVARYSVLQTPPYLEPAGHYELPQVRGLRDIAFGPEGILYAADEHAGTFRSWLHHPRNAPHDDVLHPSAMRGWGLDEPVMDVERVGKFVITNHLLDHSLVIRTVNDDGQVRDANEVRIHHDGPIWGFSARTVDDSLLLLAGGVEDHPLDRREGFFGYIDSFVFLYRVSAGRAERLGAVNVSELGVVTPKAVHFELTADGVPVVFVTGYGGERYVRFAFGGEGKPPADVQVGSLPAGSRALASRHDGGFVIANPLLDAFVVTDRTGKVETIVRLDKAPDDERRREVRLGEMLFFTNLMAPNNSSDGAHSRFSCETCHFEGYVDGRVHHTGRGDVRVVTKPLLGLFNNRPHFSRALDPDLSNVAHAEFRVAGAGNEQSPWFVLEHAQHSTFDALDPPQTTPVEPFAQRHALMAFLMDFSHRTNPAVEGRSSFTVIERQGAQLFRERCETCHEARTSTDEPASRVAFDRWESLLFSPSGPIVWAQNEYRKTGVEPYVHERGARVPSLRRLYKKRPYLTSGEAKDLVQLLRFAAWTSDGAFFHHHAPSGAQRFDESQMQTLRAFLELL